jgi:hypothetical protein
MLDRRRFLIGAGGLLTASFVRKATAFSRRVAEPLILPRARKPEETLYVYVQDWLDYASNDYAAKWRVSLGPNQPFAPPPPTWREHLRSLGRRLETSEDIERAYVELGLLEEELDAKVNGFSWEDLWDNFAGPQAKAFHLLKKLDLRSAPDSKLKQAGQIIFEEFGGSPGNSYTWVELKDDLTVSLLQARFIELNLPIDVEVCGSLGDSA